MHLFRITAGEGPLVTAAIHAGHALRAELAEAIALSPEDRLREEDPFTDEFITWAPTQLVGLRSRYEVDLNRPREQAVYVTPEQAWGVNVWREPLPIEAIHKSLATYDLFYATVETILRQLVRLHGRVVVVDVHSYNHRREGVDAPAADAEGNPEINVGTGSLDRDRWGLVADAFIAELRSRHVEGRPLDVRENVKFQGGHFPRWIHQAFPDSVCALAVEFKKTFMDEWTGEVDRRRLAQLRAALESTAPRLLQVLSEQ